MSVDKDISNFCRVCFQQPDNDQYLDLMVIYDLEEQYTFYDCFQICTQIDLADGHGIPHNLCKSCGLELQMAYDFYKKVEVAKKYLQQYLEDVEQQDQKHYAVSDELHPGADETEINDAEDDEEDNVNVKKKRIERLEELLHLEDDEEQITENQEEYQEVEEFVVEKDGETIQIHIESKSIDDECNEYDVQMSWQDAVGTVANEMHIPLELDHEIIKEDHEQQQQLQQQYPNNKIPVYEYDDDDDAVDMDDQEVTDDAEEALEPNTKSSPTASNRRIRRVGQYKCEYCEKVFKNYSRMALHRRSHEPDRPKYPCTECARSYTSKQAMETHARTMHLKTGFTCPICDKVYAINKSLEVHMRYHTGNFPYKCDLCDRKFAQMSHLKTHKNVKHHKVRFSCEFPDCGKYFTSSASLRNHEFSHTTMPFECSYCERGYPAKSKLKVHVRKKHGEDLSLEQLELMRKFHISRSKLSYVRLLE